MMAANWDNEFETWRNERLSLQIKDTEFLNQSRKWMQISVDASYSYQFDWLGVPIIQMPGDLLVFQDIVFRTRPDLIIETGVARGGSINFWASLLNLCEIDGEVLGIDIDIRPHAKQALVQSRFKDSIKLIEGSSINSDVLNEVKQIASLHKKVMVVLDSNHTHEHVISELKSYADLVTSGCFLLVLDTVIDDLVPYEGRDWGPGKSPKSAVLEFMNEKPGMFENAPRYEARAGLSVAPFGYWVRN
jgi:cephalosporin hydroxylase